MSGTAPAEQGRSRVCLTFWGNLMHDARTIRTAAALAGAGMDVTVLCTDTVGDLPQVEQHPEGFLVRRVRRPAPRRMRIVAGRAQIGPAGALWAAARGLNAHLRLAWVAFRTRADVYHAADIFPLVETWLVAKARRKPIVYEAYEISTDREGFQPLVGVIRAIEVFLVRRTDVMFATTDMRADHFAKSYGIPRPEVLQNRPPYQRPVESGKLRQRCGIEADIPIILYQGGFQPGRGLYNLLEAALSVHDAAFVLLGGGMLQQAISDRVRELKLEEKVHILPPVRAEELHAWTCSADIGVQILENTCLNHYTTDSNKLFEYALAGLAVVASDFPEIRKVIDHHQLGVLVDPDDVPRIATQLQRLVDDGALRNRFRQNAVRAGPRLSWETQVPVLLGAYEKLGLLTSLDDGAE